MKLSVHARAALLKKANVVAVWTDKSGEVKVGVNQKLPLHLLSPVDVVPEKIEGKKTKVISFAKPPQILSLQTLPKALVAAQELTQRRRPCPGGFSCGHEKITAGTLGLWVRKFVDGQESWFLLSNNHVLANSNNAVKGDVITQPGPYDLDTLTTDPTNWIGHLDSFVEIVPIDGGNGGGGLPDGCLDFLGNLPGFTKKKSGAIKSDTGVANLVDCALATPFGEPVHPDIYMIPRPSKVRPALVGEMVKKSGRTTEFTKDPVESDDLAVQVSYGSFTALFEHQVMVTSEGTPFSQGGDSGSAIVAEDDGALVGLLFAGGELEDGTKVTIANPIIEVQRLLGWEL